MAYKNIIRSNFIISLTGGEAPGSDHFWMARDGMYTISTPDTHAQGIFVLNKNLLHINTFKIQSKENNLNTEKQILIF